MQKMKIQLECCAAFLYPLKKEQGGGEDAKGKSAFHQGSTAVQTSMNANELKQLLLH